MAIKIIIDGVSLDETNIMQIRIHTYSTHDSNNLKCIYEKDIIVSSNFSVNETIEFIADENFNYAFLGKLMSGHVSIKSISLESWSIDEKLNDSIINKELEGVNVL